MNSKLARPIEILLVEDSPSDARLTREALRDADVRSNLHVVPDGVEAMMFLRQKGPYHGVPVPDLMMLDLNLPRKDGRQVLAEVKADEALRKIPVVVLTTSAADPDVDTCYGSYANCFVTKPVDLDQFIRIVTSIMGFWGNVVHLPTAGRAGSRQTAGAH